MIRVAIAGCGGIAALRHIPAIKRLDNAEITAYYDKLPERAEAYAKTYGGRFYSTYKELLENSDIDAVIICTAARSHCELSVRALEAGKHVLCEKPMAVTAKDAMTMIEAAERARVKLMISHNQRRYEPHRKARELIAAGEIGRLITFRTFLGIKGPEYSSASRQNHGYFSRELSGRGVMADVGSHRIDLMRYITGGEYKRVFSFTPTLEKKKQDGIPIDVDDNAFTIVEMDHGVVGVIITSWTSMSGNDRMSFFYGTEGVITLYGADYPVVLEKKDGTRIHFDAEENPPQSETLLTDIDQLFIQCIENDSEPLITGKDGLAVIRVLDAMEKSNLSGQWETVPGEDKADVPDDSLGRVEKS